MVTEMITLKLETNFLKDIDNAVKERGFQSRTEFIRNAVRKQLAQQDIELAIQKLAKLKGQARSKRKITEEDEHLMGELAIRELARKKGISLD